MIYQEATRPTARFGEPMCFLPPRSLAPAPRATIGHTPWPLHPRALARSTHRLAPGPHVRLPIPRPAIPRRRFLRGAGLPDAQRAWYRVVVSPEVVVRHLPLVRWVRRSEQQVPPADSLSARRDPGAPGRYSWAAAARSMPELGCWSESEPLQASGIPMWSGKRWYWMTTPRKQAHARPPQQTGLLGGKSAGVGNRLQEHAWIATFSAGQYSTTALSPGSRPSVVNL